MWTYSLKTFPIVAVYDSPLSYRRLGPLVMRDAMGNPGTVGIQRCMPGYPIFVISRMCIQQVEVSNLVVG